MFKTRKTIKGKSKRTFSNLKCLFCGNLIPMYRTKIGPGKRAWFCSSVCSKKISYKIPYPQLVKLQKKFLEDAISLVGYDWKKFIEKNK